MKTLPAPFPTWSIRASTRCEPKNPAPPVIKIRFRIWAAVARRREERGWNHGTVCGSTHGTGDHRTRQVDRGWVHLLNGG
jgi:hypothetical protein